MKTLLLKLYQLYLNDSFNLSSRTKQYTIYTKNAMIMKAQTQREPCKVTQKAMKNVLSYKENSLIKL